MIRKSFNCLQKRSMGIQNIDEYKDQKLLETWNFDIRDKL